jgi:hypothetical protein
VKERCRPGSAYLDLLGLGPQVCRGEALCKFTLVVRSCSILDYHCPLRAIASGSRTLTFDEGIPQFAGEPELFDKHLDRVETLVIQYTEEVIKK